MANGHFAFSHAQYLYTLIDQTVFHKTYGKYVIIRINTLCSEKYVETGS